MHDAVKQALLAAIELDTRLVMRPLRNTERVLTNAAVERLLKKAALGKGIKFGNIATEVDGVYPKMMLVGVVYQGARFCGMVAGLINDIPSVEELINRIMSEATSIINDRFAGMQ